MRTTLTTLIAGTAAATLAAGLALPTAAAQAAVTAAAKVPAPQKSDFIAGYEQLGCEHNAYPEYIEIQGTIVVPAATDPGAPGTSFDVYSLGGIDSGVVGGVEVDTSGGQAHYTAFAQWGFGAPVIAYSVTPGSQLEVTIENEGPSGYLVELEGSGGEFVQTNPDTNASPCVTGAYEQVGSSDVLSQTTAVAFTDSPTLWWGEQGQGVASVSKLLGTPPKYAKLNRFTLVNSSSGATMATTSKPIDKYDFNVTDAG